MKSCAGFVKPKEVALPFIVAFRSAKERGFRGAKGDDQKAEHQGDTYKPLPHGRGSVFISSSNIKI